MTTRKKLRKSPRHVFHYKIDLGDGAVQNNIKGWARVRHPKRTVRLTLKAEHVRASIRSNGVGNTQLCTMAFCARAHAKEFDHPYIGDIDWTYARAYVGSRRNKRTGLPDECYVYAHSDDIGKLNDTRGGQERLLADLEQNGDRIITLRPYPQRHGESKRGGTGRRTGERTAKGTYLGNGAGYRYAVAQLGGIPTTKWAR
jgi:hypothetical protein